MHLLIVTSLLLVGCSLFSSSEDQLDVTLPDEDSAAAEEPSQAPGVEQEAMLDWSRFFEPPDSRQKMRIQRQIRQLEHSQTPGELIRLACNQLVLGQTEKARANFLEALRLSGTEPEALLGLATIALESGKTERSFQLLSRLKTYLDDTETTDPSLIFRYRFVLALSYLRYGDIQRGRNILADVLSRQANFAPGYAALASSYIAREQLQVAQFILHRGLDRAGDHPAFFNLLGVVAHQEERPERAHSWFEKALALQADHVPTLVNQAHLFIDQVEFDLARTNLARILKEQPSHPQALMLLGILQGLNAKFDDAALTLQKAMERVPGDPSARYNLGLVTLHRGHHSTKVMQLLKEVTQMTDARTDLHQLATDLMFQVDHNRDIL